MRIVGAVFADFQESAAGGPSQLRTDIGGQTVLARTLARFARIRGLAASCLVVQPRDREAAAAVLCQTGLEGRIELLAEDSGVRPRRRLIRAARKWSLDAWRSSPIGLTWFDEFVDAPTVAGVMNHFQAEGVFCFDGHQPLHDPALADAMLAHLDANVHEAKVVFTQAPPGLTGVIIRHECLQDLLNLEIPLGVLFAYRPEIAQADPITHGACYHLDPGISQTAARLTGDTRRSRELLAGIVADLGDDCSADAICRWLRAPGHDRAGRLPIEVELELTTRHPLPQSRLRPPADRIPARELTDLDAVTRLVAELSEYDDRLVFLGGHGDPLLHPRFGEVCRRLRDGGVYGLAVGTPLVDLSPETFEALFANQVDVLLVHLDANTPETYRQVHGADAHARVVANIQRLEAARNQRQAPQPIIVCRQTRCAATIAEMEAFHDQWIGIVGSAVIEGHNDYCGLLPADTLIPSWSSVREPCRRLATRLMLLADGTIPLCGQDVAASAPLGRWAEGRLGDTWEGDGLAALRGAHAGLELGEYALCGRCRQWACP